MTVPWRRLRGEPACVAMKSLLDAPTRVRRVTVARAARGKGRMRVTTQIENVEPALAPVLSALGVTGQLVYTSGARNPQQRRVSTDCCQISR